MTDGTIINYLQSGKVILQDQALAFIYEEYYYMIEHMVLNNSGKQAQAKDVFQDGIIVLFDLVNGPNFSLKSKLKTLLYSICHKKWLMVLRKDKRNTTLENKHELIPVEDNLFEDLVTTEKQQLIIDLLNQIGEECKQTLMLFYYEKMRMNKIAETMGLASEQVAKNKKSNCMKRLRKLVMENPFYQKTLK